MQLFCDRCNEAADHPIPIASDPELADIARDLGYRNVCPGCYDDLLVEAGEAREHQADDRRTEHRVAAQVPLRISPTGAGDVHTTVTEDISDNGAQIRASANLHAGDVVRLEAEGGVIEAVAIVEVIWADGDTLRAGLRLVEASESWQQLVRDCESKQPES
jgi:hypothetical protein